MLEETLDRIRPLIDLEKVRIVTADSMTAMVMETIPSLTEQNVLGEPFGRNTCVAIGLAAVHALKEDPGAVMVVLSADHLIQPAEKLLEILRAGVSIAESEDWLITIGITPTRAETGYGYIRLGELYKKVDGCSAFQVSGFTEKPKPAVAQEYYFSRGYLWNSGMFVWSARTILKAIEKYAPKLNEQLDAYSKSIGTTEEAEARLQLYQKAQSISIDFAIMEKADNVLTMKADFVWDDIGDWNSLSRYRKRDKDNCVVIGEAVLHDTFETTVFNDGEGIIACLGVSDLIVVRSGNTTMVVHKTRAVDIKELLAKMGENEQTRKYL